MVNNKLTVRYERRFQPLDWTDGWSIAIMAFWRIGYSTDLIDELEAGRIKREKLLTNIDPDTYWEMELSA